MIYKEILRYLQTNYPNKQQLTNFAESDTEKLYTYLKQNFSHDEVLNAKNDIRNAIVEYTKDISKTVVLFRGVELIKITFTPLGKMDLNSSDFKRLVATIKLESERISKLENREDIIVIDKELSAKLQQMASMVEFIDYKDAIRVAVREALDLDSKDAVLFLNNQIYIRQFLTEEKRSTMKSERRFGGLPQEELERLKTELYEDSVMNIFKEVVKELTKTDLNFSKISNEFFEKNAVALLQASVISSLRDRLNYEDEILESFSGYLMRENFIEIHEELAGSLLEKISNGDKNAEKFIKYFTGDIAVIDGEKYRLPEIGDEKSSRWNFSTIKAMTTQYTHSVKQIDERVTKAKEAQLEYDSYSEQIERAKLDLERAKKDFDRAKINVDESGVRLAALREELASARRDALKDKNSDLEPRITELSNRVKGCVAEDEEFFKERTRAELAVKDTERLLQQLEQKKILAKRKIADEQDRLQVIVKNQQELSKRYQSMQKSIAKAMTKRKIKI